jgi:hypothetical protein
MAKKLPEPVLKSAVLCDQAVKEGGTNKWSLIGTWDDISVYVQPSQERPVLHPQCALYFKLGGCLGKYEWEVSLLHFGEQVSMLGGMAGGFTAEDKLRHVEFAFNIKMFPITKLGKHAYRLSINSKMITDVVFWVHLLDKPQGENQ